MAAALPAAWTWRQEVHNAATPDALRLLRRAQGVNVPHKERGEPALDELLRRCAALRAALPPLGPVCAHFSLAAAYRRTADATFARLESFAADIAALGPGVSLLLVSGGGPRRTLDAPAALERLAASAAFRALRLPLAVAFNPYFPTAEQRAEELRRLRRKLASGLVSAVYLQAGSDAAALDAGLHALRALLTELAAGSAVAAQAAAGGEAQAAAGGEAQAAPGGRPAKRARRAAAAAAGSAVQLYGSLLVPSKRLLAQMRFRPWGGVFLRCPQEAWAAVARAWGPGLVLTPCTPRSLPTTPAPAASAGWGAWRALTPPRSRCCGCIGRTA